MNTYKQQISSNPAVKQVLPGQTFGAHINMQSFLRPLSGPLFNVETTPYGSQVQISFFSKPPFFVPDAESIRRSKSRSVLKLVEKGLIPGSVLTDRPDDWPFKRTPTEVVSGDAFPGDVIFGLDSSQKPRRALVLCTNGVPYDRWRDVDHSGHIRDLTPRHPGFIVLWSEGIHWGRRTKVLSLENIRKAYAALSPEVYMALEARCALEPEISMAGDSLKIPI